MRGGDNLAVGTDRGVGGSPAFTFWQAGRLPHGADGRQAETHFTATTSILILPSTRVTGNSGARVWVSFQL